jgi:hypothetical protein
MRKVYGNPMQRFYNASCCWFSKGETMALRIRNPCKKCLLRPICSPRLSCPIYMDYHTTKPIINLIIVGLVSSILSFLILSVLVYIEGTLGVKEILMIMMVVFFFTVYAVDFIIMLTKMIKVTLRNKDENSTL